VSVNRFTETVHESVQKGLITDVHQHLWPPTLIAALRERRTMPRLRGWTLELEGEADYEVHPAQHDPHMRAAQARGDGLDLAIVSLSSPLGIEFLAAEESAELLGAYHDGALALPAPFRAWAAASLTYIDPAELERQLDRGCVGLQLPATTLLDARGYELVMPLLEVLERRERPLFVHPGPASSARLGGGCAPGWWPAVVDYVNQMHAAWYAFRVLGRPHHPRLRVCFALLAGLAPLHGERFLARSGERTVLDPWAFLDISSYGTRAIDATVRVLGIDVLVNGSDRPYVCPVEPNLGDAARFALCTANPCRLLNPKEVSHGPILTAGTRS
jgi:6-methylsalicylate decarboxylase